MTVSTYGHWWRGCIQFVWGRWRVGLTQDFLGVKVGISFGSWQEINLLFWTIDLTHLTPMGAGYYALIDSLAESKEATRDSIRSIEELTKAITHDQTHPPSPTPPGPPQA